MLCRFSWLTDSFFLVVEYQAMRYLLNLHKQFLAFFSVELNFSLWRPNYVLKSLRGDYEKKRVLSLQL